MLNFTLTTPLMLKLPKSVKICHLRSSAAGHEDVSCFTERSVFVVSALEDLSLHITFVKVVFMLCFPNCLCYKSLCWWAYLSKSKISMSSEKLSACENSFSKCNCDHGSAE